MLIKRHPDMPSSEITDEQHLPAPPRVHAAGRRGRAVDRRRPGARPPAASAVPAARRRLPQTPLAGVKPNVVTTDEPLNTFEEITSYNNFYEFGTGKGDPGALRRAR